MGKTGEALVLLPLLLCTVRVIKSFPGDHRGLSSTVRRDQIQVLSNQNLYQIRSGKQSSVKRVLRWHPQGWECKIHMGCNEISTDLVWEGNSRQRGNAEILKTFCYATGTFVSCRKAVVGFRDFIPRQLLFVLLSSNVTRSGYGTGRALAFEGGTVAGVPYPGRCSDELGGR